MNTEQIEAFFGKLNTIETKRAVGIGLSLLGTADTIYTIIHELDDDDLGELVAHIEEHLADKRAGVE